MGYSSGEFDTGAGPGALLTTAYPGAAAIYATSTGKQVWCTSAMLAVSGTYNMPAIREARFAGLEQVASGAATAHAAWTAQNIGISGLSGTVSASRVGLVMADYPYLFWNSSYPFANSGGLYAAVYGAGQPPSTSWGSAVSLHGMDEAHSLIVPSSASSGVSATLVGSDTIVLACSSVSYTAPNCTKSSQNVYLGIFNTADRGEPESSQWIPRYEYTWASADLQSIIACSGQSAQKPTVRGPGNDVSIDWFVTQTPGSTAPVQYLAMFFTPELASDAGVVCLYLPLILDQDGLRLLDASGGGVPVWDCFTGTNAMTIARDPAGRLRGYVCSPATKSIDTFTFTTVAAPNSAKSGSGQALPVTNDSIAAPSANGPPPAVAYYLDQDAAPQQVQVSAQSPSGQQQGVAAQQYPVYEILLYTTSNGALECQISTYAYAQRLNSALATTTQNVITGIMDGPIPVANANLDWKWANTDVQPDLGTLTYSAELQQATDHQSTFQWSGGFKSEGEADKGAGPAWDISFSAGTGSESGSLEQTAVVMPCSQPSPVDDTSNTVVPYGHVWCNPVQFNAQLFRFIQATGPEIVGDVTGGPAPDGSVSLYAQVGSQIARFSLAAGASTWTASTVMPGTPASAVAGNLALLESSGINLYYRDTNSQLCLISSTGGLWLWTNLSAQANGQQIAGDPVPVSIDGNVHVFAAALASNHLFDLSSTFATGYQDVSGAAIAGRAAVLVGSDANHNTTVRVFARLASNAHLMLYQKDPYATASAWAATDLSAQPGGPDPDDLHGMPISGNPVVAPTGDVYACGKGINGQDHHLLRFFSTSAGWRMNDVSSYVDWSLINGDPTAYVESVSGSVTLQVFAQRSDGHLVQFTKAPDPATWQATDLSASATGGTIVAGNPVALTTGGHVYVRGTDEHVLDFALGSAGWQVVDTSVDARQTVIYDATSSSIGQAPQWALIQPTYSPPGSGPPMSYVPFSVTPGDLSTYTVQSWNQTMQALGQKYPHLYQGADYFNEVIDASAAPLVNSEGLTLNYLPIAWGGGANAGITQFEATSSSFVEQSYTLNDETYVGASGGEEVSVFGLGEDDTFKFLVGTSINYETNTKTSDESNWGISLEPSRVGTWGPPMYDVSQISAHPKAMSAYEFRIYLLPPPNGTRALSDGTLLTPNYWVQELKTCLQAQEGMLDPSTIDDGACAWRMVFVVTAYTSNDGTLTYP